MLLAMLLAAGPLAGTGFYEGSLIDDLGLAQRFFNNPAAAETALFGKRLAILGRVQSIRRQNSGQLFDLTLAPRTTPAMPVECALSRGAAAQLGRGQLVIVEGRLGRERGNDLRLRDCRVAYDFRTEELDAGVSCDSCLLKFLLATCKGSTEEKCQPAELHPYVVMLRTRLSSSGVAKPPIICANPLVAFIWGCESHKNDEEGSASCTQRSEVIRIRNEITVSMDGKSRIEADEPLWVTKPERSKLLDSMIRGAALPDEEP